MKHLCKMVGTKLHTLVHWIKITFSSTRKTNRYLEILTIALIRITWLFLKLNKPIIKTLKNFKFNNNSLRIGLVSLSNQKGPMNNLFTRTMLPKWRAVQFKVILMELAAKLVSCRWNRGWWMNYKLNLIRMINYKAMKRQILRIRIRHQPSWAHNTIPTGILTQLSLLNKVTKQSWWWTNSKIKVRSKSIEV